MPFCRLFIPASVCLGVALAQTDRVSITGTVRDPGVAVIAGTHIPIRNPETASAYDTLTTDTGNYLAAQLPAAGKERAGAGPFEISSQQS